MNIVINIPHQKIKTLVAIVLMLSQLPLFGQSKLINIEYISDQDSYEVNVLGVDATNKSFIMHSPDKMHSIYGTFTKDKDKKTGVLKFSHVKQYGKYLIDSVNLGPETNNLTVNFIFKKRLEIVDGSQIITFKQNLNSKLNSFDIMLKNSGEPINLSPNISSFLKHEDQDYYSSDIGFNLTDITVKKGSSAKTIFITKKILAAGIYKGSILLEDEYSNPYKISVSIHSKHNYKWPLFIMIIGLLIGYITKIYRDNLDNITLLSKVEDLFDSLANLPESQAKKQLLDELVRLKNDIPKFRLFTITQLTTRYEAILNSYYELAKTTADDSEVTSLRKKEVDKVVFKLSSVRRLSWFRKYMIPLLILFSSIIMAVIVFNKLYIEDPTFGASLIPDYLTILLSGAVSSSTSNIIFGKKYSDLAK